jgi:hypothetical protein
MLAIKQTASNTLHNGIKYLNLHTNNFCIIIASSIILLHYSNLTPAHANKLVTLIFKVFNKYRIYFFLNGQKYMIIIRPSNVFCKKHKSVRHSDVFPHWRHFKSILYTIVKLQPIHANSGIMGQLKHKEDVFQHSQWLSIEWVATLKRIWFHYDIFTCPTNQPDYIPSLCYKQNPNTSIYCKPKHLFKMLCCMHYSGT